MNLKQLREAKEELIGNLQAIDATREKEQRETYSESELERFDAYQEELKSIDEQIETQKRVEQLSTFTRKDLPDTKPQRENYAERDVQLAARAWLTNGTDLWREEYGAAADRIGFKANHPSLKLNLFTTQQVRNLESYTNNVGTPGKGGYTVNAGIVFAFEKAFASYWDWQSHVDIYRPSTGGPIQVPNKDYTSKKSIYVAELENYTPTDVDFGSITLNTHKLGDLVGPISEELILDSEMDILSIVGEALGERMALALAEQFTLGDGEAGHIKGFTVGSIPGIDTKFKDAVVYEDLVKLFYSVGEKNQARGIWQMSSQTLAGLVALTDDVGRPLFQAMSGGLQESPRLFLFGRPVIANDFLESEVEIGNAAIYFGNFKNYKVRLQRDPQISASKELYWLKDGTAVKIRWRGDGKLCPVGDPIKRLVYNTASGAPGIDD